MPLATRNKLAVTDLKTFDFIARRHLAFAQRQPHKPAVKQAQVAYPPWIGFIHRLPLLFLNRFTTVLQKAEAATRKQIPVTSPPQLLTIHHQTQTFVNTPSIIPSASATSSPEAKAGTQTIINYFPIIRFVKERSTFAPPLNLTLANGAVLQFPPTFPQLKPRQEAAVAGAVNPLYAETAKPLRNMGTTQFQGGSRSLFAQSILVHSRRLHLFVDQIVVNRLKGTAEEADNGAALTRRLPQTARAATARRDFEGAGEVPKEHFINNQSQIARNGMKQAGDESAASKPQQKPAAPDLNALADKVYQLIERKARIERERRG